MNKHIFLYLLGGWLAMASALLPVQAATLTVTTTQDSVANSLRQAIEIAESGDVIKFSSNFTQPTFYLADGELPIDKDLTIDGTGARIQLNGFSRNRIFKVMGNAQVTLKNLHIRNGVGEASGGDDNGGGGAIYVKDTASLTIDSCTFSGNHDKAHNVEAGKDGGVIRVIGTSASQQARVEINNSTFLDNFARNGSVLYVDNYAKVTMSNSTLISNQSSAGSVVWVAENSTFKSTNNLFANNNVIPPNSACGSGQLTFKHTLSEHGICGLPKQAKLTYQDQLDYYGGNVPTLPLLAGSAAINAGDNDHCTEVDARGEPRPRTGKRWQQCDVGAYELQKPQKNLVVDVTHTYLDTNTHEGENSLRDAVYYADPDDTITFSIEDVYGEAITLGDKLEIDKNLTIDATGAKINLTRIFQNRNGLLSIANGAEVKLRNLNLSSGTVDNGNGGALHVGHATVKIENSAFIFNDSGSGLGGAIHAEGENPDKLAKVDIDNSTFSQNYASAGGAISAGDFSELTITNSTIAYNFIEDTGVDNKGILQVAATASMTLANSVVMAHSMNDCYFAEGSTTSVTQVFSYDNTCSTEFPRYVNPKVDSLAIDNEGDAYTAKLATDSPLINAGDNTVCGDFDARGKPRNTSGTGWAQCDIGAYEYQRPSKNSIVDSVADTIDATDGVNTLREAIFHADANDDITFSENLYQSTIKLNSPLLVDKNLTIDGNDRIITLEGMSNTSLLKTTAGDIVLSNLTFKRGSHTLAGSAGGAITNQGANLTINRSTFVDNYTQLIGGAIYNQAGKLTVNRSTFHNNSAIEGGAVFNETGAELTLRNVTIANTTGTGSVVNKGIMRWYNTLITGSSNQDCIKIVGSVFASNVNNFTSDGSCSASLSGEAYLSNQLTDNGGYTKTLALLPNSPAINAGSSLECTEQDQRGIAWEGNCDIGAFAYTAADLSPPAPTDLQTTYDEITGALVLTWTYTATDDLSFTITRNEVVLDSTLATQYIDENIACGMGTLSYTVVATVANGLSEPAQIDVVTEACADGDPQFAATPTTSAKAEILLSWKDISDNESGYALQRDGTDLVELDANRTSFTDKTAACNQTYTYALLINEGTGYVPIASELVVTTPPCPPHSDAQLFASAIAQDFIELSWTDVSQAETAYHLQRDGESLTSLPANSITFHDGELTCETSYVYTLVLEENTELTELSTQTVTTASCQATTEQPPLPPTDLQAIAVKKSAVTLVWTDNSSNETSFKVLRDGQLLAALPANTQEFTDHTIFCAKPYQYSVFAQANALTSPHVDVEVITAPCDATGGPTNGGTINPPAGNDSIKLNLVATVGGRIKDCGIQCEQFYPYGSVVTLRPESAAGYTFTGWSAACGAFLDDGNWLVALEQPTTCIAEFTAVDSSVPAPISSPSTPAHPNPPADPITTVDNNASTDNDPIVDGNATTDNGVNRPDAGEKPAERPVANVVNDEVVVTSTVNTGRVAHDVKVEKTGSLSGGTVSGDVTNAGIIANVKVEQDTVITGGTISGYVENEGTIQDVKISQYAQACGGKFDQEIINQGTLCDFEVLPTGEIKGGKVAIHVENSGELNDVDIERRTSIIGGQISGYVAGHEDAPAHIGAATILSGTRLDHVRVSPTVKISRGVIIGEGVIFPKDPNNPTPEDFGIDPTQYTELNATQVRRLEPAAFGVLLPAEIMDIPPTAFNGLSAADMSHMPAQSLAWISPQQFAAIPNDALSGLTAANLAGLPPEIISELEAEQLELLSDALQADAHASGQGLTKVLSHLDTDKVPAASIETLLDDLEWDGTFDADTGEIAVPAGTQVNFKTKTTRSNKPAKLDTDSEVWETRLEMPDLPDISTNLTVGGQTTTAPSSHSATLQDSLQLALDEADMDKYKLSQTDSGVLKVEGTGDFAGIKLTFMPEVDNIVQIAVPADNAVPVGLSTTEGGFQVITTPQGYQLTMIPMPQDPPDLAKLVGDNGQVKINAEGDVWLTYEDNVLRRDLMVNQVVLFDPFVETAPPETEPGIYADRVVYSNGTMQSYQPTLPYPDVFRAEALKIDGVEGVTFNVDGTFSVVYMGTLLRVRSTGEVNRTALRAGERVLPAIMPIFGGYTYQVQENLDVLQMPFILEPM